MTEFPFPKFTNPPLVEVVCSVLFEPTPAIRLVDIGLYWISIRDEFPIVTQVAPIAPVVESYGPVPDVGIEVSNVPQLPRQWFARKDNQALIQVQENRFLYNWKKSGKENGYPSFDEVSREFFARFDAFSGFLQSNDQTVALRQFELTYVNHIHKGQGWDSFDQAGRVLVDHARDASRKRFLPSPEGMKWQTLYLLPNQAGRLRVTARNARDAGGSLLRIDATARGIAADRTAAGMRSWFSLAHEWVVKGFADSTSPEMHKRWGRTQ